IMCWALALLHVVLAVRTARNQAVRQSNRKPKSQVPIAIASSGAAE
ncbi:MAG: hypothetical protein JHD07_32475, partial [Bradyrhizobium sp.]|nr:hypothetical protein [Bradyrhizobium sp.]